LIRTAVIANSLPTRAGLKALLEADDQIEVIAVDISLPEMEKFSKQVDVIVSLPDSDEPINWATALPQSVQPPAILLLSDTPQHIESLARLNLPGWGVLPTDFTEAELISALYAVDAGLITVAPIHLNLLNTPLTSQSASTPETPVLLTNRELEVLTLLSDGLANKQISIELGISEHTVKFHVSSIYQKLNVSNRAEAVRLGIQLGLILV
jgi:NarL family two-component system response regulator YdfI